MRLGHIHRSDAVAHHEQRALWSRVWVPAAAGVEVQPDRVHLARLGPWPLVLTRHDGQLRAFFNTCPHRGHTLCAAPGPARHLKCPYHHWTFGLDGKLRHRPDPHSFSRPARDLTALRTVEFGGLVWVCADPEAPALAEWLGDMGPLLEAQGLEEMALSSHVTVDLSCNWKLSTEVHLESYHVHALHTEVLPWVDDTAVTVGAVGMHGRMEVPLAQPSGRLHAPPPVVAARLAERSVSVDGLSPTEQRMAWGTSERTRLHAEGVDTTGLTAAQLVTVQFLQLFPAVQLNAYGDRIMLFRHHPHHSDPGRCQFEQQIFVRRSRAPVAPSSARHVAKDDAAIGPVTAADLEVAENLQTNSGSPAFLPDYGDQERLVAHFYDTWDAFCGEGASIEATRGARMVSSQSKDDLPSGQ